MKKKKHKQKIRKRIIVEWHDHVTLRGWKSQNEFDTRIAKVIETGFFVSEDSEKLIIAGGYEELTNDWLNVSVIPKRFLKKIKTL